MESAEEGGWGRNDLEEKVVPCVMLSSTMAKARSQSRLNAYACASLSDSKAANLLSCVSLAESMTVLNSADSCAVSRSTNTE